MAASGAAAVAWALTSLATAAAENPDPGARTSSAAAQFGRARDRYLIDLSQVKNATLESESAFFERLERQKKIEEMRFEATFVAQKLRVIRLKLSPPELDSLGQAEQSLRRSTEPIQEAAGLIGGAVKILRDFHEARSPWAADVAAGRAGAAPYLSQIRRYIRAADRKLNTVALQIANTQKKLEQADELIAKSLTNARDDDPRRAKLLDSRRAVESCIASLTQSGEQVIALVELLDQTRRTHLPDCSDDQINTRDSDPTAAVLALNECQGSIAILQQSRPAIERLQQAYADLELIKHRLSESEDLRRQASSLAEQADAIQNPTYDAIRRLAAESDEMLDRTDEQLNNLRRTLTSDVPGQVTDCSHCGRTTIRTRKVVDPACLCSRAYTEMLETEKLIQQVRGKAEEMSQLLNVEPARDDRLQRPTPQSQAASELRGSKGVLDQLSVALERGHEFRTGKFDPFPGDISAPDSCEPLKREFPPMVATYAARSSWHYPLYFEDISAERYGLHHGCFQPIVSYSKFIADLALLPYNFCLDHPHTIQYDLGMYRPGDCAPHLIYLPRPDWKAAAFQAAVWTGIMYTP